VLLIVCAACSQKGMLLSYFRTIVDRPVHGSTPGANQLDAEYRHLEVVK